MKAAATRKFTKFKFGVKARELCSGYLRVIRVTCYDAGLAGTSCPFSTHVFLQSIKDNFGRR